MKPATILRALLALILLGVLAGCDESTAKSLDAGADTRGGLFDAPVSGDGETQADGHGLTEVSPVEVAPVADGAVLADAPPRSDGSPTGDTRGPKDGSNVTDGPAPSDGVTGEVGRLLPDGSQPPDGSAKADAFVPSDVSTASDSSAVGDAPAVADGPPTTADVQPGVDGDGVARVTIAIVGDTAQKGRTAHTRAIASLIRGHAPPVAGLFIAGDCVRYDGNGTLLDYFKTYWASPTESNLAQFDDIVFPQLGNHEYGETDAQGYFDYFGDRLAAIADLPSYDGSIATVGRGWYGIDLNGWHVVSLNANCSKIPGGCSAGGAQERWLASDLAQHAGMPIIAIWHQPRWTCTLDGHGNATETQPLWADLYDAHADFVFNGHNHFYQRYKPLDKADSAAVDEAAGITEIIVGIGGSSTYKVCSPSADTRVAKALDGDTSLGSFFLTLGSDGSYDWEYRLKNDGSVFDAGSGRSHNAP